MVLRMRSDISGGGEEWRVRIQSLLSPFLIHLSIPIAAYAGGILSLWARLRWDPTTYVPLRVLAPDEYHLVLVALPFAAMALLLLPHLAIKATRLALFMYACLSVALCVCASVMASQVQGATGEVSANIRDLERMMKPFFRSLPQDIQRMILEAEGDVPRNLVVVRWASAVLATLLAFGALLSLVLISLSFLLSRSSRYSFEGSEDKEPLRLKKSPQLKMRF